MIDPRPTGRGEPTENHKGSQNAFAERIGTDPAVVSRWKEQKDFRRLWRSKVTESITAIDRIQTIFEALAKASEQGNAKATENMLRLLDRISPDGDYWGDLDEAGVEDLSDEELAAAARALIEGEPDEVEREEELRQS